MRLAVGLVVVVGLLGIYHGVNLISLSAARAAAEEQVAARVLEETQRVARVLKTADNR